MVKQGSVKVKNSISKPLDDFALTFKRILQSSLNDEDTRRMMFDGWIKQAGKEVIEVQPYARLTVCSTIVRQAFWGSDKEIAHYVSVVLDDMVYAADAEYDPNGDYYYSLLCMNGRRHEHFVSVLVRELTIDQIVKYLDAVINAYYFGKRFCHSLNTMLYALRAYVDTENYDFAVKFGGWILNIYKDHDVDYNRYKQDTSDIIKLINFEIYRAHEKLGTATKEMIETLDKSRPKPRVLRSEAEIAEIVAERIAFMNQAESCRAEYDMQGYYDYMSIASEIGQ